MSIMVYFKNISPTKRREGSREGEKKKRRGWRKGWEGKRERRRQWLCSQEINLNGEQSGCLTSELLGSVKQSVCGCAAMVPVTE